MNSLPPGTELVGQGSFVAAGIFSLPLKTPVANLPVSHITASVADNQGNWNTMKLRFWIEPPALRILSVDVSQLPERRLTLRVQDPSTTGDRTVLCSDDIAKRLSLWTPVTVLRSESEPNGIQRLEVELPASISGRCFLQIERR